MKSLRNLKEFFYFVKFKSASVKIESFNTGYSSKKKKKMKRLKKKGKIAGIPS